MIVEMLGDRYIMSIGEWEESANDNVKWIVLDERGALANETNGKVGLTTEERRNL
jgi:hypothetical protein